MKTKQTYVLTQPASKHGKRRMSAEEAQKRNAQHRSIGVKWEWRKE